MEGCSAEIESKREKAMTREQVDVLLNFYDVDTLEALVEALAHHIEKLQAKVPSQWRDTQPGKVREG